MFLQHHPSISIIFFSETWPSRLSTRTPRARTRCAPVHPHASRRNALSQWDFESRTLFPTFTLHYMILFLPYEALKLTKLMCSSCFRHNISTEPHGQCHSICLWRSPRIQWFVSFKEKSCHCNQYLPLVEVIPLTHLDAVKDMIASVDHGLVVLVDELTSWIHLAWSSV